MKLTRISILAGAAALMTATACTDINTPTDDPNARQKEGAVLGALTGAFLGRQIADDPNSKRNLSIAGAIAGGLAGSSIGKNLDEQAAALRSNLSDGRIQVINTGSSLIVRMPNDILFPFDSASVAPALRSDLRTLASHLQTYPGSLVQVIGHTDSTGDAGYNQSLSVQRASAVANILVANGVSAGRVVTVGRGENEPVATNLTPEGRAQNRRVDIVIIPQA